MDHFKVEDHLAIQLRLYFLERRETSVAMSRQLVSNLFTNHLVSQVVWSQAKALLAGIPCFHAHFHPMSKLPVDKQTIKYLCRVAQAMKAEVYVPKDRPPARRLYIISSGFVLYTGQMLGSGKSWGSQDVLVENKAARALMRTSTALTYLHVLYVDGEALKALAESFPIAHRRTKRWVIFYLVGDYILTEAIKFKAKQRAKARAQERRNSQIPMKPVLGGSIKLQTNSSASFEA